MGEGGDPASLCKGILGGKAGKDGAFRFGKVLG